MRLREGEPGLVETLTLHTQTHLGTPGAVLLQLVGGQGAKEEQGEQEIGAHSLVCRDTLSPVGDGSGAESSVQSMQSCC